MNRFCRNCLIGLTLLSLCCACSLNRGWGFRDLANRDLENDPENMLVEPGFDDLSNPGRAGRLNTGDWDKAVARSSETGKPLMLIFTGSDWCQWCTRLDEEVLDTPALLSWADEHVVTVEVDFPRNSSLPGDQRVLNETLKRQYADWIKGFPTVLLVDAEGNVLGNLGYRPGGPDNWIGAAESILARRGESAVSAVEPRQ